MDSNEETETETDPMNIRIALDILEISLDNIKISDLTTDFVKQKYHKLALIWHPDKNKSKEATNKFQKINEAYEYLMKNACVNIDEDLNGFKPFVSSSLDKDSNIYSNILGTFISSIIKGDYKECLMHIIKEIVLNYNSISVSLFEDLDKHNAVEIYTILLRYKDVLYIKDETLDLVSSIIKEKYKNDKVFILKPSLNDLWDNKIYKLYVDDELYLVPLWHNELYFDCKDGSEIIVICQPELDNTLLTIDENNNIHCNIELYINKDLRTDINDGNLNFYFGIGDKELSIPYEKLYIKKKQIYRLKNQGISRILEDDIYNVSCKADIIVHIELC
jgi:DnaJ domain